MQILPVRTLAFALALALGSWSALHAQVPESPTAEPAPTSTGGTQPAQDADTEEAAPTVAPDSPLAALEAFLAAANARRWNDAAGHLSLIDENRSRGAELAERLKSVIDSWQLIDLEAISPESEGRPDDGLPPGRDQIALVPVGEGAEPIRMIRTEDDDGAAWRFSPATVARIDGWYENLPDRWLREFFRNSGLDVMLRSGPLDILWWQWLALPIVALLSWGVGRLIRAIVWPILARLTARTSTDWDDRVVQSVGPPLTLAFGLLVFAGGVVMLRLTRDGSAFTSGLLRAGLTFAFFWGLWRSTAVISSFMLMRPWAVAAPSTRHLLTIGANVFRGLVAGIGILAMVAALGYPVGTILAGLGIGGLALAFGAQKTVENIFGSVALAIDQPIRVGDFVRVDDFVGTVEDVGLRSTRFRTLDRTVVSVQNGQLADKRLESLQARDRMRLATTIGVTYGTTQAQIARILEGFERVLRSHPKIWPDAMVVRFAAFGASSLDIEIMAWFNVPTWADFQLCRQEILLEFMGVVEGAGSSFAFPTQTIHLVQEDSPAAATKG